MAYWTKHFSFMEEADFDLLDTGEFTVIQRMSYNYVEQSKTDTKVADKVMKRCSGMMWIQSGYHLEILIHQHL